MKTEMCPSSPKFKLVNSKGTDSYTRIAVRLYELESDISKREVMKWKRLELNKQLGRVCVIHFLQLVLLLHSF